MANRIFVLCDYPFPEGMAPTNRILAYAKGLNNNITCEVLTFTPMPKDSSEGVKLKGTKNGVIYHRSHSYSPQGNKFYRVFVDLRLFRIKAIQVLLKENRLKKIDLILVSFDKPSHLMFFVPLLRLLGFTLAFISDEFPPEIRRLKPEISYLKKIFYKVVHKAFSCRITMTRTLRDYYNNEFGKKPTHILNTIVDIERFNINRLQTQSQFVKLDKNEKIMLCYMGNMELEKDNVDNIILAINLLKLKYPNILLHLYGTPSEKAKTIIDNLIALHELENYVQFKGRIPNDAVPYTLGQYNILVTSQPKTMRAAGGFPTKLGEYLMSGVPAIATNVGEINEYVKDNVHVFFVEPDDPVPFASKLEYVINNYEHAKSVAITAREYMCDNFSCNNVTKEMAYFLNEIIEKDLKHKALSE